MTLVCLCEGDTDEICRFVRQYTLASGGPYCDCGYKKKVLDRDGKPVTSPIVNG